MRSHLSVLCKNGSRIISHSLDGMTKIWDVKTGKEIITHVLLEQGDWLVRNQQGFFDATENAKRNIFFVRGMRSYALDQFFEKFYQPGMLGESLGHSGQLNQNLRIEDQLKNSPPPRVEIMSPKARRACRQGRNRCDGQNHG